MKTSVEIDQRLYECVKRILGTDTLRATIEKSFEAVVHHQTLEQSAKLLGRIDLDLSEERLRRQRRKRHAFG